MATINLLGVNLVDVSSSDPVVNTPAIPTVSAYGTWYSAGTAVWTADPIDATCIIGWVLTEVSNITCASGEDLAISVRQRLYDNTFSVDVPAGTYVQQVLRVQNSNTNIFGNTKAITNFNQTFTVARPGILQAGHQYTLYIEVRKARVVGTPSCDLTVIDSTIFNDSAAIKRPNNSTWNN